MVNILLLVQSHMVAWSETVKPQQIWTVVWYDRTFLIVAGLPKLRQHCVSWLTSLSMLLNRDERFYHYDHVDCPSDDTAHSFVFSRLVCHWLLWVTWWRTSRSSIQLYIVSYLSDGRPHFLAYGMTFSIFYSILQVTDKWLSNSNMPNICATTPVSSVNATLRNVVIS